MSALRDALSTPWPPMAKRTNIYREETVIGCASTVSFECWTDSEAVDLEL